MFMKWDSIHKYENELITNEAVAKDRRDMIQHYQDQATKFSLFLELTTLTDAEKRAYRSEANGAFTNVSIRQEALKGHYTRQKELKAGIKNDYQDIGNLLKELNILANDIKKHNKDFENEIIKTFPEFFKLGVSDNTATSPTIQYPLSKERSYSLDNLKPLMRK